MRTQELGGEDRIRHILWVGIRINHVRIDCKRVETGVAFKQHIAIQALLDGGKALVVFPPATIFFSDHDRGNTVPAFDEGHGKIDIECDAKASFPCSLVETAVAVCACGASL